MDETTAPAGFPIDIAGITLDIQDDPDGGVRRAIADEIVTRYKLPDLYIPPHAVILDIGAHVGVVSCYLSVRWADATIYAFEPVEANYRRLERNLRVNGCENVRATARAVTCDGRELTLSGDHTSNTGGYSAWSAGPDVRTVQSVSLPSFLAQAEITRIALL